MLYDMSEFGNSDVEKALQNWQPKSFYSGSIAFFETSTMTYLQSQSLMLKISV